MSADTEAAAQIRLIVDRILRLKEEQDALTSDIKDIYLEAKGNGLDKTALGRVVAHLRKAEKDSAKHQEAEANFELYLDAYQNGPRTRMREPAREARDATPADYSPVAQDEGQPVQVGKASDEAPERGVGGEFCAGQSEEFVTAAGAGEAVPTAVDPAPAPDILNSPERASELGGDAVGPFTCPDRIPGQPVAGHGPRKSGTLPPDRLARLAEYEAREKADLPPLDPNHPLYAIRFKARYGRDPDPMPAASSSHPEAALP